jgi:hypothetical protein
VFITDPREEIFNDNEKVYRPLQAWPRVDTSETYYQVFIIQSHPLSTDADPSAVLLSTPSALVDFIVDCQRIHQTKIQEILVTLPPHIHDGESWITVKLVELMVRIGKEGRLSSIQYRTNDETYVEYLSTDGWEIKLDTIYQAV